tara:strand:- start:215 stop:502 length:288 start_codon:yes stop_codon:yes gene_type:complete
MDVDAIEKKLVANAQPKQTLAKKYGVMGLCLGQKLHVRLRNYAFKKNIKMATLIKELLVEYLDKVESKDQENTNGLDQIDHMEKKMLLNQEMDNT